LENAVRATATRLHLGLFVLVKTILVLGVGAFFGNTIEIIFGVQAIANEKESKLSLKYFLPLSLKACSTKFE